MKRGSGEKGRLRHYFGKPSQHLGPKDFRRLVNEFGGIPSLLMSERGRDFVTFLAKKHAVHLAFTDSELAEFAIALTDLDLDEVGGPLALYNIATLANVVSGIAERRGKRMSGIEQQALRAKDRCLKKLLTDYPRDIDIREDKKRPDFLVIRLHGHAVLGLHMLRSEIS